MHWVRLLAFQKNLARPFVLVRAGLLGARVTQNTLEHSECLRLSICFAPIQVCYRYSQSWDGGCWKA